MHICMIVGIGKAASTAVMASTTPSGNQATINTQLQGPLHEGGVLGMVADLRKVSASQALSVPGSHPPACHTTDNLLGVR